MARKSALTPDVIIKAAVRVADENGLAAVSMRNVARELGFEAMSLYHHIANKAALLDSLVSWIFPQIELPTAEDDWRTGMSRRATSARHVLAAHPWAVALIESRPQPVPELMAHHDAVLGCLRRNGFATAAARHAFSLIDAYIYGFVINEANLPIASGQSVAAYAEQVATQLADYPYLLESAQDVMSTSGYDFADEFQIGLGLILQSIAKLRQS